MLKNEFFFKGCGNKFDEIKILTSVLCRVGLNLVDKRRDEQLLLMITGGWQTLSC